MPGRNASTALFPATDPDPAKLMPLELSKTLLAALRCPESKQPLSLADKATMECLNRAIATGTVKNLAGNAVTDPIEAGLIRDDRQRLYPITDGFPIMLIDESVELGQLQD